MRTFRITLFIATFFSVIGCQDVVDDINDNDPNTIGAVDGRSLLTGMQLADITAQSGYLNWAAGVWTGNFVGSGRFDPIQNYQYGNTNSNTPWRNIYVGVVKQARELRSGIPVSNKDFFFGVSKVLETHALGTAVNVFGKVPFTQAGNDDFPTPEYEEQLAVYSGLQTLLDEAISDLQNAGDINISEDLFFGGDANKWVKAAYTLKARLYLDVRDYSSALAAVQNGISSEEETMKYTPPAVVLTGDTNLLNQFFNGSFPDDLAVEGSYLISLLGSGPESRNNTKTNEVDRSAYYYTDTEINDSDGGIAGVAEPMNQISLQENLLIWAEAALRLGASNFDQALSKLNEHRANLRNGVYFSVTTNAMYDDYVETDFTAGGVENIDGSLSKEDALLREIIEERYATFFADILSFNDLRRFKKDPVTLQVGVPFNVGDRHPERFLYPFSEENTNGANVPDVTDIFVKTDVNQ
ncbi:SusD/RagB family nutrient-binding outer membrane lipoprotein [Aquimarina megaterium]|uniref:SusD/RagB family nutrient-binding outer membrane lipoprotein n=1 Tax=Aquimarina megaterium TaxID=1443666 RepID=UPI0004704AD9|nr:SusD/RagB family nutrient-binding outer membrane lipoprotein [Aquimarina megaterium]